MTNEIVPSIVAGSQAIMNCGILDRLLKHINYYAVDYSWRFHFTFPSPSVTEGNPQCAPNPIPQKDKRISIGMDYNCIDINGIIQISMIGVCIKVHHTTRTLTYEDFEGGTGINAMHAY